MTTPPAHRERQPRDAGSWARARNVLRVSDVPAGAVNPNVDGRREVGALQGFGQLWQKTYTVRLTGASLSPEEVVRAWKQEFPDFHPPQSRFYPSIYGVAPGERLPEAGWNTFSAYEENGTTLAQIQSLARASDPAYEIGFRLFGSTQQEKIWTHVLSSLAARFGVREQVRIEKACVDPKSQWFRVGNLWHNASLRSVIFAMAAQARRARERILRRG